MSEDNIRVRRDTFGGRGEYAACTAGEIGFVHATLRCQLEHLEQNQGG